MAADPRPHPSFSPYRRWGLGLQVGFTILLVLAVMVMLNYLSRDYYVRMPLTTQARFQLHPRTTAFLQSVTNHVKVTVYYDRDDSLFNSVSELLNEYHLANPRIEIQAIDFLRNPGAAQKIKTQYKLGSSAEKNLIIFDCEGGGWKIVDGGALAQYTLEEIPDEKDRKFRRKPLAFAGERAFTAALIAVTSPKPLKAYFLTGHGEHRIDSGDELRGYLQFALVMQQNYVQVAPLSLLGTNDVPADCNLLVIAGPTSALLDTEAAKVEGYLEEGGRLLALFNSETIGREIGLEKILARWGVAVGSTIVVDPDHTATRSDVIVSAFTKHPLVNSLLGSGLYLVRPRPVGRLTTRPQSANAPRVDELAFTCTNSFLLGSSPGQTGRYPLAVAVEAGPPKGAITERGSTRILVVGDSYFLANHQLDLLGNRDFADAAVNWLLDRPQLVQGLGPRPVTEYRLVMSKTQLQSAQIILLGGMPGGLLLLGALVWLRRRT